MEPHIAALVDSKFAPFWLDREERPKPLPSLSGDARCQLLIVGGGFTGLWGALQAKENNPDLDIILIEATEVGDGASGRNGGFISNTLAHGETNAEYHFPGETEILTKLGNENMQEIINALERHQIDAHFEETGELTTTSRPEQNEGMAEWVAEQQEAGEDLVWFDQDEMRREVNSPTYFGGLWDRRGRNGVIDPARLCWGLKKAVLSLGVRIFEGTSMRKMDSTSDGMSVECDGGQIRCDKVLMGTNAFRNPLAQVRRSVIPIWDYALVTEPLSDAQWASVGWERRQGLANEINLFHYYRRTRDGRITWGGGSTVSYYYGNRTDASCEDPRAKMEQISKEFFEIFPQLEGLRFTHRWSGIIASTTRFCMAPGSAYDGRVAWAVGYTGHGVSASRFGARIGLELLGFQPTEILDLQFVRKSSMAWPPEPLRWAGVTYTHNALERADANEGKRGLWLKLLDRFQLGLNC